MANAPFSKVCYRCADISTKTSNLSERLYPETAYKDETLALIAGYEDAEITKTVYGNLPVRQQEEIWKASQFWLSSFK